MLQVRSGQVKVVRTLWCELYQGHAAKSIVVQGDEDVETTTIL